MYCVDIVGPFGWLQSDETCKNLLKSLSISKIFFDVFCRAFYKIIFLESEDDEEEEGSDEEESQNGDIAFKIYNPNRLNRL